MGHDPVKDVSCILGSKPVIWSCGSIYVGAMDLNFKYLAFEIKILRN